MAASKFGQLSKAARDRAARIGRETYGLTRRQVRERYNRGTYNPYARKDPQLRIPREFRDFARRTEGGTVEVNWHTAAYANMRFAFGPTGPRGDREKYNDSNVEYRMKVLASDRLAQVIAQASPAELEAWASVQPYPGGYPDRDAWQGLPPDITLDDIGYFKDDSWYSVFWYH